MPTRPKQNSSSALAFWAECCLWAIGMLCLGYCANAWIAARLAQTLGSQELTAARPITTPAIGGVQLLGRLEIPRLGLSSVVFEGDDAGTLQLGVGHLPSSALPGKTGNVVLAAHRDSFFRPIQDIHPSDVIKLTTAAGTHSYIVQSANIVTPQDTAVLNRTVITGSAAELFGPE